MYYFVQNVDKKIEMRIFEMLLMLLDTKINDKYHLIGFLIATTSKIYGIIF